MNILSFIVWNPNHTAIHFGSFEIRWYALCWMIGLALAYFIVKRLYKEQTETYFPGGIIQVSTAATTMIKKTITKVCGTLRFFMAAKVRFFPNPQTILRSCRQICQLLNRFWKMA